MSGQATPLPWISTHDAVIYGPDEAFVAVIGHAPGPPEPHAKADAALIVRAVNAHADMLAALRCLVREIKTVHPDFDAHLFVAAERAIAKAEGSAP